MTWLFLQPLNQLITRYSGIGFSICKRIIDEFLTSPSRDPDSHLVLIVSTRSVQKTRFTIDRLRQHLRQFAEHSNAAKGNLRKASQHGTTIRWQDVVARVHFLGVELDLCDLCQIYHTASKIRGENGGLSSPHPLDAEDLTRTNGRGIGLKNIRIPRLDVLILNAGISGWTGLRYGSAIWAMLTDLKETVTWFNHNISSVGKVVKPQCRSTKEGSTQALLSTNDITEDQDEPPLGEVFTANVFGHYILAYELMPLLRKSSNDERAQGGKGRVIWMSSLEPVRGDLNLDDIQGLESKEPYRASKRLMDILALTADLPNVRSASASWFAGPDASLETEAAAQPKLKPNVYIAHPGIASTDIVPVFIVLAWLKVLTFYIARWLGSPWMAISNYKAAVAPTWLALADQRTLNSLEGSGGDANSDERRNRDEESEVGKGKWGSSTDFWGEERVRRTEVPGWGWTGKVDYVGEGEKKTRKGRKRDAIDITKEEREEFEIIGRQVWLQMETLRREWEQRLGIRNAEKK